MAYLKNPRVIWEPLLPFRMRWRVIWLRRDDFSWKSPMQNNNWPQYSINTRILMKMPLNALLFALNSGKLKYVLCAWVHLSNVSGWNLRLSRFIKSVIPFSGSRKQLYLWIWFFKSLLESSSLYRTQSYHRTFQTWGCPIWCFCWGWTFCHSSSKEKLYCICQWSQSWIP